MNGRKAMQSVSGAEMLCKEQAARKSPARSERRGIVVQGVKGGVGNRDRAKKQKSF